MSNIISSSDPDAGVRVAITPSQSAYFAGEPFSVTITFTNTRNAEAGPSKTPSYSGHKRGAHSISSAPLSRPPTSPGTPRLTPVQAPLVARAKSSNDAPIRKGLVGKSTDELALEQRRKKLQGKSLSVSISPADLDAEVSRTPSASAGPHQRSFLDSATYHRSPLVPATLPRTDALPLSRNHPHARKDSVVDLPETPSIYPPLMTPNSSTSSFSLDTIAEGARNPSYPNTPILGSPTIEPASPSRFGHPIYGHHSSLTSHPRSRIGLGHPSSNHPYRQGLQTPHSASSSTSFPQIHQPNSEVILYSYAQLTGSVVITPSIPGAGAHVSLGQEHVNNLKHVRASLLKKNVIGGGSMDINSSLLSRTPSQEGGVASASVAGRQMAMSMKGHGRSSSLTGALFSMLSPSALFSSSSESLPSSHPSSSGVPSSGRWRSSSSSSLGMSGWPEHDDEPRTPGTPAATSGLGLGLGIPTSNPNAIVTHYGRSRRGSSASRSATTTHGRRSSVTGWILGGNEKAPGSAGAGGTSSGSVDMAHSDPTAPLPTFEVQPAMLAVDLVLAPGESRSYTYTVNLPDNLPPTFRGKAIHFSYELVVGLCRAGQSDSFAPDGALSPAEPGGANVSKLMKVPIRLYNNVVVDHAPKPYNLLWPVDKRMDLAMPSSQAKVAENDLSRLSATVKSRSTSKGKAKGKEGLEEFLRYTSRLLDVLPPPEPQQEQSMGEDTARDELEIDRGAESPTTPSPPRRETPAPEDDDIPVPDSPGLDPTTPTSSNTPSDMSLSPHPSRSASSSPPPPSSQSSAPPPSSPPEASQRSPKPTNRPAPRKPAMLDLSFESHRGRQSHEYSIGSSRDSSVARTHEEGEGEGTLGSGCREAVEILTRTQKKASYDVTKDGVKVAILTFPKSSYRLGETISGVVEINERKGRARVVQLAAFLEAHESLPSSLFPPSANRYLKRTYTEHFSSHLLNTLRTTFSLDIPSDASPAFQTCVGTPKIGQNTPGGTTSFGGLEWKVRLCLLVAVAGEDTNTGTEGVRFKGLIRDGPRGEWGSGWRALPVAYPLEKPKPKMKSTPGSLRGSASASQRSSIDGMTSPTANSARSTSWTAFFASYLSPSMEQEYHDGDELGEDDSSSEGGGARLFGGSITSALLEDGEGEDRENLDEGYDGIKPDLAGGVGRGVDFGGGDESWKNAKLEMVECEVPVRVWPGNTAFKAMDVVFEV